MLEHFVLSSLLFIVCCWSSSYFPILEVLCLDGLSVLLHDQCCSSHDDQMPFPNLDANLQIDLFTCYTNQFTAPTDFFQLALCYPFSCFQLDQCWVSGFSSYLASKYRKCNPFRVSLMIVTARSQWDTLPKPKMCTEHKYKGLLVVP